MKPTLQLPAAGALFLLWAVSWLIWLHALGMLLGLFEAWPGLPLLLVLLLPPWFALRLQSYAAQGRADAHGKFCSPFLPADTVQSLLDSALDPLRALPPAELPVRLWKTTVTESGLEGYRDVSVSAGVYPADHAFGGANATLIDRLTARAREGGAIVLVATLQARHQSFPWLELRARERVPPGPVGRADP